VRERSLSRAAAGAHALAGLTEWDEFKRSRFSNLIYRSMRNPAFAFDGRNILPHALMQSIGFDVQAIGKSVSAAAAMSAESVEEVPA
jgi:UDPglucose 6-dehydrogenase